VTAAQLANNEESFGDPDLDRAIDPCLAAARSAWPEIFVERARFVEWLMERARGAELPPLARASDLYLTCACAHRVSGAVEAFDRRFLVEAKRAIVHVNRDAAFVDEALQIFREKLFVGTRGAPKIVHYEGRGPLALWVSAVACRTAWSLRREGRHVLLSGAVPDVAEPTAEPEIGYMTRRYGAHLAEAIRAAFAALESRDRLLLERYYAQHLSVDRLGSMYGVGRSTAWRWLVNAREKVRHATRTELARRFALSQTDFDSVAKTIIGELDVGILRSEPTASNVA
jgi:RNA polymerase sigma-70 factor (ECF subfamily)